MFCNFSLSIIFISSIKSPNTKAFSLSSIWFLIFSGILIYSLFDVAIILSIFIVVIPLLNSKKLETIFILLNMQFSFSKKAFTIFPIPEDIIITGILLSFISCKNSFAPGLKYKSAFNNAFFILSFVIYFDKSVKLSFAHSFIICCFLFSSIV